MATEKHSSFVMVPTQLFADEKLTGPARFVYVVLCKFRHTTGTPNKFGDEVLDPNEVYPGQKLIASITGFSTRTVMRALRLLRESGYLTWRRAKSGRLLDVNIYKLLVLPPEATVVADDGRFAGMRILNKTM
jgi:hypothetical protein